MNCYLICDISSSHFAYFPRFWYENPDVFESNQLAEIRQVTLSRVVCDSSDGIDRIQRDAFTKADAHSQYLQCKDIPKMNFKVWADCCTGIKIEKHN